MKRLVLLLVLVSSYSAFSQIDTIHAWQRVNGYYYEDTNWWNHYCFNVPPVGNGLEFNLFAAYPLGDSISEYARYLFSDTSLKVIGIGAAISYSFPQDIIDTLISHRPTEFFRLYVPEGGDMKLKREAAYTNSTVKHRLAVDYWKFRNATGSYNKEEIRDLYEAYFDSPIIVKDSFYVSGTQYGNQIFYVVDTVYSGDGTPMVSTIQYYRYPTNCFWITKAGTLQTEEMFVARPDYYKKRFLSLDSALENGEWNYVQHGGFVNIFPIIDTNFYAKDGSVGNNAPTGLKVSHLGERSVLIEWNDNAENYELNLRQTGDTQSELDTIIRCPVGSIVIESLNNGLYTVCVRSISDGHDMSPWSDGLEFLIDGNHSGQLKIDNSLDQFTYLMPNPARTCVTVASSFRINKVTIFDMKGNVVTSNEANGISTLLDVSMLAKGMYIVSISTVQGIAHKRLIID